MSRRRVSISGFSFIRNGAMLGFPFVESVRSLLPLVDEFVIAVGKSDEAARIVNESIARYAVTYGGKKTATA